MRNGWYSHALRLAGGEWGSVSSVMPRYKMRLEVWYNTSTPAEQVSQPCGEHYAMTFLESFIQTENAFQIRWWNTFEDISSFFSSSFHKCVCIGWTIHRNIWQYKSCPSLNELVKCLKPLPPFRKIWWYFTWSCNIICWLFCSCDLLPGDRVLIRHSVMARVRIYGPAVSNPLSLIVMSWISHWLETNAK